LHYYIGLLKENFDLIKNDKILFLFGLAVLAIFIYAFILYPIKQVEMDQAYSKKDAVSDDDKGDLFDMYFSNDELVPFKYERLIVKKDSLKDFFQGNIERLSNKDLVKFFKGSSISTNFGFCFLKQKNLYEIIFNFNKLIKIPIPIFNKMYPENWKDNFIRIDSISRDDENRVYLSRKFEKYYGYNELNEYYQVFVVGSNDTYPTVYLLVYDKEDLELLDFKEIYRNTRIVNGVYRIKSCLNQDFTHLTINEIYEFYRDTRSQDTIKKVYVLSNNGKWVLQR
jgi:hypothetical protein